MSMDFQFAAVERHGDRAIYCAVVDGDEALSLNMCNANARDVASALGMFPDEYGEYESVPLSRFLVMCKAALRRMVGRPDAELQPSVEGEGSGPTMIFCGRAEGYVHGRIGTLLEMARRAEQLGAERVGLF